MFSEKEDLSEKEPTVVNKVVWSQSLNKSDSNPWCSLKAVKCFTSEGNLRSFSKREKMANKRISKPLSIKKDDMLGEQKNYHVPITV